MGSLACTVIYSIPDKSEQSQFLYIIVDVTFIIVFMVVPSICGSGLRICVTCTDSRIISVSEVFIELRCSDYKGALQD